MDQEVSHPAIHTYPSLKKLKWQKKREKLKDQCNAHVHVKGLAGEGEICTYIALRTYVHSLGPWSYHDVEFKISVSYHSSSYLG